MRNSTGYLFTYLCIHSVYALFTTTYLYRQPLLVTWRVIRVCVYRSVLVIVKCSVCSGNRIIGTHLRNSLLISKISVKHRVLNQNYGLRTSLSAGHQDVCHPKPYDEWHQLHHQRLRALDRVSSSVLPTSPQLLRKGVLSKCLYHVFRDFLGCHAFLLRILYDLSGLCCVHV